MGNENSEESTIPSSSAEELACSEGGECTWEATNSKPQLALEMTGLVNMTNAVMPILLFYFWRFDSPSVIS